MASRRNGGSAAWVHFEVGAARFNSPSLQTQQLPPSSLFVCFLVFSNQLNVHQPVPSAKWEPAAAVMACGPHFGICVLLPVSPSASLFLL